MYLHKNYDAVAPLTESDRLLILSPEERERELIKERAVRRSSILWTILVCLVVFLVEQFVVASAIRVDPSGVHVQVSDFNITPCSDLGNPRAALCESRAGCGDFFLRCLHVINLCNILATLSCALAVADIACQAWPAEWQPPHKLLSLVACACMLLVMILSSAAAISVFNLTRLGVCGLDDGPSTTPAPHGAQNMLWEEYGVDWT